MVKRKDNLPLHPRDRVTGRPPTFKDFSPEGKKAAEAEFKDIASNPRTRAAEAAANATSRVEGWEERNPGKPHNAYAKGEAKRARQMETATTVVADRRGVTMNKAAHRVAENYLRAADRTRTGNIGHTPDDVGGSSLSSQDTASVSNARTGRGTVTPVGSAWYEAHSSELRRIAAATGGNERDTIVGSTTMSPQNEPSSERAAATAISYATHGQGGRHITMRGDSAAAMRDLDMEPGQTKNFNDLTSAQVAKVARHREHLDGNVNLEGIAKGGTEVAAGTEAIRGQRGQEEFGQTGKVPSYTHQTLLAGGHDSLGEKGADANDISEFNRRTHESIPGNHPYFEQPTLFGKDWEADPYGRAHSTTGILNPGHQPDAPHPASVSAAQFYPESTSEYERQRKAGDIQLHEGTSAMDTWAMAQSLALPRHVEAASIGAPGGRSPQLLAKALASDPSAVSTGGGAKFMETAPGSANLSGSEAQHAIFNEVNNRAAGIITEQARAAGRNVGAGVPAVAVQASSWTSYRMDMDKDPDLKKREAHIAKQDAPSPISGPFADHVDQMTKRGPTKVTGSWKQPSLF